MSRAVFRHEAMATHFEITVAGQEEAYARQAAGAAFRELDRLEGELSRFVESSDIARANRLAFGGTLVIGDDALECLLLAAGVAESTRRAFDPAYGSERRPGLPDGAPAFTLDPAAHVLASQAARLDLDLGAVGKGYALDRLADVLAEWGIDSACLNSGGSTALALGAPPSGAGWPVGLGDGGARRELMLEHAALSGSGLAVKGPHLVDPRIGRPAARTLRAWARAPLAAVADALSTAFFVMSDLEVAAFCAEHPGIGAAFMRADGRLEGHGTLGPQVAPQ
ncbi:MAG TPA: FAD:protein FMN transferase [Opitutaceae bacterium]|nr:FAD:protein FMN transferase [Opitutaceae bacterium]